MAFVAEIEKKNIKIHLEAQKTQNNPNSFEKKKNTELEASNVLVSKYFTDYCFSSFSHCNNIPQTG